MGFFSKFFGKKEAKIKPAILVKNLAQDLFLSAADIEKWKKLDELIVIGKVLEVLAHPDPQITKVKITKVDIGTGKPVQILCGGSNIAIDQIVPVATLEAKLSDEFVISVREIRGEESFGMICSRRELGLSLAKERAGEIWVLPASFESFVGKPLCILL